MSAGLWETGPGSQHCNNCGSALGNRVQFLGLSNGDYGWYCDLTCVIEDATSERSMFTDGVGPRAPSHVWDDPDTARAEIERLFGALHLISNHSEVAKDIADRALSERAVSGRSVPSLASRGAEDPREAPQ